VCAHISIKHRYAMLQVAAERKERVNEQFSENALKVMRKRYLIEREDGIQENPADLYARVANALAAVEKKYGKDEGFVDKVAQDFFDIMSSREFTPAGRTLTNAGGTTSLVANCIVLPIHDSMESIFQTMKDAALLQQAGSGLGFDLSEMRPADFITKRSRGRSSGPVSFLRVYDAAFGTIKQQGRHGANMSMMRVDHPDILEFIRCKKTEGQIRNFNISVTITDEFMRQLEEDPTRHWYCSFKGEKMKPRNVLRHPNGVVKGAEEVDITVGELFDELVESAWTNGEPGIAFIDTVNRTNPLPGLGPIASSNPCGEQFLHPYDNCNLGSINLERFVKDGEIDWERLRFVTATSIQMLDNVIDLFDFPVKEVTELALKNRRIGLGIMGFGDMLFQLGIPYNSSQGFAMAEKVMQFIQNVSHEASEKLAGEKGVFPNYDKSVFAESGIKRRNAALTTVAPTGSISMMFDVSSGIEPNFALAYVKQDKDGQQYQYFNQYFEKALHELQISSEERDGIMEEVVEKGTIQHLENLPKELRDIFVISMDISGEDHMKMQAAFQVHVDNSISKTINFPNSATKEEVAQSFISAWKKGCKSATVYRDGSRVIQVLNIGSGDNVVSITEDPTKQTEALQSTGSVSEVPIEQDTPQRSAGATGVIPRKRPEVMDGKTYRMQTGYGKLYVTVNNDEKGIPFEIFATIGKSGGFYQEQSEAICRLISLALRSGVEVGEIIDDLKGIRGPAPVFSEKGTILSLPDALGKVLEEHVTSTNQIQEVLERPENQEVLPFANQSQSIADYGFMPGCPDCGSPLVMQEGCISCRSCGFSRCG